MELRSETFIDTAPRALPGSPSWNAGMDEWRKAKAIMEEASDVAKQARARPDEFGATVVALLNDRAEAAVDAFCEVEHVVLTTPAPDAEALLWKLDRLYGEKTRDPDGYGESWCGELVESFMADAKRFLSAAN